MSARDPSGFFRTVPRARLYQTWSPQVIGAARNPPADHAPQCPTLTASKQVPSLRDLLGFPWADSGSAWQSVRFAV